LRFLSGFEKYQERKRKRGEDWRRGRRRKEKTGGGL
jgi:hypothetical protein